MNPIRTSIAALLLLLPLLLRAQAPQRFSYQAVLRDAGGAVMASTDVTLIITLRQGSMAGTAVYAEIHYATTNAFGLVNVAVGGGETLSGSMTTLDWSAGPYFIETKVNGTVMGTTQLLSVPYALYAGTSGASDNAWGLDGTAGTSSTSNYIGTADEEDLTVRLNAQPRFQFTRKGQIAFLNPNNSVLLGNSAGVGLTSGSNNVAVGHEALAFSTTGSANVAVGGGALFFLTTGQNNVAVGRNALRMSTSSFNTAVGSYTLAANTSGSLNTGIGYYALFQNTTAPGNTAVGYYALLGNTTGAENTAVGRSALSTNATGTRNTAVGARALLASTGSDLTAVGHSALGSNTTGTRNSAFGSGALSANTTGFRNAAFGGSALAANTTGRSNLAMGPDALSSNTAGSYNVALGSGAQSNVTTGTDNVAVGVSANQNAETQSGNTAVGSGANSYLIINTDGERLSFTERSTFLGSGSDIGPLSTFIQNGMALGSDSRVTGSNQVRVGNTAVWSIGGYAGWTNFSDGRYKRNVQADVPGLAFIRALRPVTYNLDVEALAVRLQEDRTLDAEGKTVMAEPDPRTTAAREAKGKMLQTGFIAQEVEAAAKKLGFDFSGVDAPQHADDLYGLRYAEFVVPLVKAVQEQQALIEEQARRIDAQQAALEALRAELRR